MTSEDIKTGLAAFFEQDHIDCEARWADVEELLDTEDIESARPAWQKYDTGMRRHLAMEEEILFPAFEAVNAVGDDDPTADLRKEHQQMRELLDQIVDAMNAGDAQEALDIGDTLLILIQQHNDKEEANLYPVAENMLGERWDELAAKLETY